MNKGVLIGWGLAAVVGVVVLGGFLTLIASGVCVLFAVTQPVADGAGDFLSLLAQDKIPEAYASAGGALRAQGDEASFTAAVRQLGLTDYVSASWTRRNIENQNGSVSGSVEGTVSTKSGTAPAEVALVYEQGKWRVVGMRYARRDLADLMAAQVPADEELRRLATEALLDLDQAVQAKDFTAFYAKLSDKWRQQTTAPQLQKECQAFIDNGIALAPAKDSTLRFDAPATIDPQGLLVFGGNYQTGMAQKVNFKLKYIHEAAGWALFAVAVKT